MKTNGLVDRKGVPEYELWMSSSPISLIWLSHLAVGKEGYRCIQMISDVL